MRGVERFAALHVAGEVELGPVIVGAGGCQASAPPGPGATQAPNPAEDGAGDRASIVAGSPLRLRARMCLTRISRRLGMSGHRHFAVGTFPTARSIT